MLENNTIYLHTKFEKRALKKKEEKMNKLSKNRDKSYFEKKANENQPHVFIYYTPFLFIEIEASNFVAYKTDLLLFFIFLDFKNFYGIFNIHTISERKKVSSSK